MFSPINVIPEQQELVAVDPNGLCFSQLVNATECLDEQEEGQCDCYMAESLETDYPLSLFRAFSGPRVFLNDNDPEFCEEANSQVCDYFKTHSSCCCTAEADAYRRCLFDSVFVPSLSVPTPCKDTCNLTEKSIPIEKISVFAGSALALILLFFLSYLYFPRSQKKSPGKEVMGFLQAKLSEIDNASQFKDEIVGGDEEQPASESEKEVLSYSFSSKRLREEKTVNNHLKENLAGGSAVSDDTNANQFTISDNEGENEGTKVVHKDVTQTAEEPSYSLSDADSVCTGASKDQTIKFV